MKPLSENLKALYEYKILEKFEAGISLNGQEVKSIKNGRIDLKGTYVTLRQTGKDTPEVFMIGANIPPYQPKNAPSNYDPFRERKLLLTKQEIKGLVGKAGQKGLTIVPLKVYTKKGKIKVEIALVKGKSKADKRETIKKREIERDIRNAIG